MLTLGISFWRPIVAAGLIAKEIGVTPRATYERFSDMAVAGIAYHF